MVLAELEQGLDLTNGSGLDDRLWDESKIRSVIGVRAAVD
jgi:hypothetical protein